MPLKNETLGEWYLRETGQDTRVFRDHLARGQRVGQAFFNSLSPEDQERLRGTLHDPFYGGVVATHKAIDFLCRKGG